MELGFVGLGRMGMNMVQRLVEGGHDVVAYNRTPSKTKIAEEKGARGAYSFEELAAALTPPRAVWLMVPAGAPVDGNIEAVLPSMQPGDLIIDGGNSLYKDTVRRAEELEEKGFRFMDVGTSGGVWGLEVGYCMMIGAAREDFERVEPALLTLAPPATDERPAGYAHVGPVGAGHLVKMVHNGIEYGMMQAYAEGFEILQASQYDLDLKQISVLWNQGSVIRSWLLELAERVFEEDPNLDRIKGYVEDSGEGRWTVFEAIDRDVPAPVITLSLLARFVSRQDESFAAKTLAALRNQFGGHAVRKR